MKRNCYCQTEVNLLIWIFQTQLLNFTSVYNCKQAIDKNFRQSLLIKQIQKLAKTSNEFVSSMRLTLVGEGWQRSLYC